jgi:predicted Zn-dependent protease with MMP-like domain
MASSRDNRAARTFTVAPTLEEIEQIAAEALASIPPEFRRHTGNVRIHIEDFPTEEIEKAMELESPFDLLGLYQGVSMAEKSVAHVANDIDRVFLYRRPLLDYWIECGEDLAHLVRHVLIHEIGHHFGLSDEDMDAIEAQAQERAAAAQG